MNSEQKLMLVILGGLLLLCTIGAWAFVKVNEGLRAGPTPQGGIGGDIDQEDPSDPQAMEIPSLSSQDNQTSARVKEPPKIVLR